MGPRVVPKEPVWTDRESLPRKSSTASQTMGDCVGRAFSFLPFFTSLTALLASDPLFHLSCKQRNQLLSHNRFIPSRGQATLMSSHLISPLSPIHVYRVLHQRTYHDLPFLKVQLNQAIRFDKIDISRQSINLRLGGDYINQRLPDCACWTC